ncbi:hypothetical protein PTKIN_Ptkin02bG0166200 [Pterospermum kingtungense]
MDSYAEAADSFVDLVWFILDGVSDEECQKFGVILVGIWKSRNAKLWNQESVSLDTTVHLALEGLYDWLQALSLKGTFNSRQDPPSVGIGIVLRDDAAGFFASKLIPCRGLMSVKEAEALGLLQALQWVGHLQFEKVLFETDASIVRDAVYASGVDLSEFG